MDKENKRKILENIANPIVLKALKKRRGLFVFNYKDKSNNPNHVDEKYEEHFLHKDSDKIFHRDYIKGDENDPNYDDWWKLRQM